MLITFNIVCPFLHSIEATAAVSEARSASGSVVELLWSDEQCCIIYYIVTLACVFVIITKNKSSGDIQIIFDLIFVPFFFIAAIPVSMSFNIKVTNTSVYTGEQQDFFGYKVLQFTSGSDKG